MRIFTMLAVKDAHVKSVLLPTGEETPASHEVQINIGFRHAEQSKFCPLVSS